MAKSADLVTYVRSVTWGNLERTTGFEPATLTLAKGDGNRPFSRTVSIELHLFSCDVHLIRLNPSFRRPSLRHGCIGSRG